MGSIFMTCVLMESLTVEGGTLPPSHEVVPLTLTNAYLTPSVCSAGDVEEFSTADAEKEWLLGSRTLAAETVSLLTEGRG